MLWCRVKRILLTRLEIGEHELDSSGSAQLRDKWRTVVKAVFINCSTFLIISLSSNTATRPKCNVIDLYTWHVNKNYSDLLYVTYNLSFLVCSKVSTRCNSSSRGKNTCDITVSFCRIAIIVYHVGDKNSVLFPQLSVRVTRPAQQNSCHVYC